MSIPRLVPETFPTSVSAREEGIPLSSCPSCAAASLRVKGLESRIEELEALNRRLNQDLYGKKSEKGGGGEAPAPETFPPSPARPRPSKGTSERRSEIPPRAPCRPCRGRPSLPTGRSVPDVLFPSWRSPERRPRRRSRSTCGPIVGSTIANATGRPAPVPAPRGS